jgi:ribosomal protein S18 acetylase RimI-like enzyme
MKAITKEFFVENALEIPGLILRGFRGEEDYPGMLTAYKAAMDADGVEASDSLEELRNNYNHLERCDVYKDMIMAEIDGEMIAYGRTWWDAEPDDTHTYTFFVNMKPEWRGKGVGTAMAKWLIARIGEIAGEHPADGPKFLQGWSSDRQPWQTNLLEKMGMEVIRYGYEMNRPCSEPIEVLSLPEGIEVQPITPELMRAVFDAENEAFRDHWGYIEPTETSYQGWLNWPMTKPDLWKVAFDGDEIVGMVRNYINHDENDEYNRKRGYTENISVRRPWRRKGVARALLTQSIQMFIEMGMDETCLGVDTKNPNGALALYSDVGYKKIHTAYTYRKPLD